MACDARPRVGAADQHAVHRYLVDRQHAAGGFELEMAGQPLGLAAVVVLALAQQHGTARFQFLCEGGHGLAGARDVLAVALGRLGRSIDLGCAFADRDDELRRAGRVAGDFAGGGVLFGDRAVDGLEYRADGLDRLRDAVHRIRGAGGVALQRVDLFGDLLRRALGLHRECLDLGGDDRKASSRSARARGLDGRVEREQRRLPCDLCDQVDDVADGGRGFA